MKNVCSVLAAAVVLAVMGARASAAPTVVVVKSTDIIELAGRTDVTIAPAGTPPAGYPVVRHSPALAEVETFPQAVTVTPGTTSFQFSVTGLVNYNTVLNNAILGPDGAGSTASLNAVGGISGFNGPAGGFVGVFLTDANPANAVAPSTLNFSAVGGTSFTTLSPGLGQLFFIGDGLTGTGSGSTQSFVVPSGATRLFLGIQDGLGFTGTPGAVDDNSGSYTASVTAVPEPASLAVLGCGGLMLARRRRR